jgi:hypothetical protein
MALEDVVPVRIATTGPCKGCALGFLRELYQGKWYHEWEGRAYPCTEPPAAPAAPAAVKEEEA